MTSRDGVTLPELAVVAWLFTLVLLGLARFATAQGRLIAATHDRLRFADAVRTTDLVLNGELRYAAGSDLIPGADSVWLRAVRGTGTICGRDGAELRVRYQGIRRPDPQKDSALVVTAAGTLGSSHEITGATADDDCGGGFRLTLSPSPTSTAGLVMVFETGSYHLADGGLRYRRGRAGRQPVTEGVLADGRFELLPGGIEVRLALHPDSVPRLSRLHSTHMVHLLNAMPSP